MTENIKLIYVLTIPKKLALSLTTATSKLGKDATPPIFKLSSLSEKEAELSAIAGTVLPGLGLIDGLADQLGVKPFPYTPL